MNGIEKTAVAAAALLGLGATLAAGPGAQLNFFRKPNIANIFHPEVGKGALYETKLENGKTETMEMSVVGRESVDGLDGYWFEVSRNEPSGTAYTKFLVTKEDFRFRRMVMQLPGKTPMEMPMTAPDRTKSKVDEELDKWTSVGTESVTVPAGTFLAEHWRKAGGGGDLWASPNISPMGVVKEVSPKRTMVLVKVIPDAQDHITGTPQKFDRGQMRQQMMDQLQKDHPRPQ